MGTGTAEGLDAQEMRAWRSWIEASTRVAARIERDLRADSGLTLDDYEVLVRLSEAPGDRLRMADLARQVANSPSRLSQRVDRMERVGLLRREKCEDDRRGWYAVMTGAGRRRLEAAAPAHVDSVRANLLEHLTDDDVALLADLMPRLARVVRE